MNTNESERLAFHQSAQQQIREMINTYEQKALLDLQRRTASLRRPWDRLLCLALILAMFTVWNFSFQWLKLAMVETASSTRLPLAFYVYTMSAYVMCRLLYRIHNDSL